jgi:hypothetical protein
MRINMLYAQLEAQPDRLRQVTFFPISVRPVRPGIVMIHSSQFVSAKRGWSLCSKPGTKHETGHMLASHNSVPAGIDTILLRVYLSECTCTSVELRIVTTYSEQEKGEQHMSI